MPGVVEATAMPLERLEAEITQLAAHLDAAGCRWLLLVAEFDRRAGYETWGCRSCAQWLSWHCGVDERAARERVRVARALEELPAVRDAFASGRLSYSKVRALTRIATAGNEDELVDLALHATAVQVERIVRAYRGVRDEQDETAEANRRHAEPHVRLDANDDGTVSIHGRLPAEMAAVVRTALDALRTRGPAGPAATTNADALVEICETYLAVGPHARTGGERTQVVVHVGEDRECTLDDDTWIAPETARRLACDASVVEVRPGGTASKRTRTVPAATRRAVPRATAAAGSRAVTGGSSSTCTTSGTGRTAGRTTSPTSSSSAGTTIASSTKEAGRSGASQAGPTGPSSRSTRSAGSSDPGNRLARATSTRSSTTTAVAASRSTRPRRSRAGTATRSTSTTS